MAKINVIFDSYMDELSVSLKGLIATKCGKKGEITTEHAIALVIKAIDKVRKDGKKLIFVGNGGSSTIASHQAVDFWKNGGIKAIAFNDPSLLTCISNDYGYEYVFEKPVEMFAEKDDILFAISSSGMSDNILNAVKAARKRKAGVVTLSGFSKGNDLRKLGDVNFYVPSGSYGIVEIAHLLICHSILDHIIDEVI